MRIRNWLAIFVAVVWLICELTMPRFRWEIVTLVFCVALYIVCVPLALYLKDVVRRL